MEKDNRLSNIEILRILAMAMIVLLHCNYWMNGGVIQSDVEADPIGSFWRILSQQICIVGANVFVLISGWFGIKPKIKSGFNFMYQVVYHSLIVLVIGYAIGLEVTTSQLVKSLALGCWNWFVPCYLGLFVLAPVLNKYVDNTPLIIQRRLLLALLFFEAIFGWALPPGYFEGGYSIVSFVILYLLARYLRLREEVIIARSACFYFIGYLLLTLLPAMISFGGIKFWGHGMSMASYDSPIVIAASTFLLLGFSRTKINKGGGIINWAASSIFAVIMIHVHPVIAPYFRAFMKGLYAENTLFTYSAIAIAIAITILTVCILLDQPRKYTWNKMWELVIQPLLGKLNIES